MKLIRNIKLFLREREEVIRQTKISLSFSLYLQKVLIDQYGR